MEKKIAMANQKRAPVRSLDIEFYFASPAFLAISSTDWYSSRISVTSFSGVILDPATRSQLGDNAGIFNHFFDGGDQSSGDFFRHARRGKEGVPYSMDVLAIAELGQHRNIWKRRALARGNEPSDLSAL